MNERGSRRGLKAIFGAKNVFCYIQSSSLSFSRLLLQSRKIWLLRPRLRIESWRLYGKAKKRWRKKSSQEEKNCFCRVQICQVFISISSLSLIHPRVFHILYARWDRFFTGENAPLCPGQHVLILNGGAPRNIYCIRDSTLPFWGDGSKNKERRIFSSKFLPDNWGFAVGTVPIGVSDNPQFFLFSFFFLSKNLRG